jgi:hypothetical protein
MSAPAGAKNAWHCGECGRFTVAVHVDEGVTPFVIGCRATPGCQGLARSIFYPPEPWPSWAPEAEWEWYRPTPSERQGLAPEVREHVREGGLLLRRIDGQPDPYTLPPGRRPGAALFRSTPPTTGGPTTTLDAR